MQVKVNRVLDKTRIVIGSVQMALYCTFFFPQCLIFLEKGGKGLGEQKKLTPKVVT